MICGKWIESDPTVLNTSCSLLITGISASIFSILPPVGFQKYRLLPYFFLLFLFCGSRQYILIHKYIIKIGIIGCVWLKWVKWNNNIRWSSTQVHKSQKDWQKTDLVLLRLVVQWHWPLCLHWLYWTVMGAFFKYKFVVYFCINLFIFLSRKIN